MDRRDEGQSVHPRDGDRDRHEAEVDGEVRVHDVGAPREHRRDRCCGGGEEPAPARDGHAEPQHGRAVADALANRGGRRGGGQHGLRDAVAIERARQVRGVALHAPDRVELHEAGIERRRRRLEARAHAQHVEHRTCLPREPPRRPPVREG
jgi:hypothetical protein